MSTGVESWTGAAELTALYPFPGLEMALLVVAVVIWLIWHVWQIRSENKEYDDVLRHYNEVGLEKALDHRGRHDSMMDSH